MSKVKNLIPLFISGTLVFAGVALSVVGVVTKPKRETFTYLRHETSSSTVYELKTKDYLDLIYNSPLPSEYLTKDNLVETSYSFTLQMDKKTDKEDSFTQVNYTYYPNQVYIHYMGSGNLTETFGVHFDLYDFEFLISKNESLFRLCRIAGYKNMNDMNNPLGVLGYEADQALLGMKQKWIKLDVKEVETPPDDSLESGTRYYQQMLAVNSFKLIDTVSLSLYTPKFMAMEGNELLKELREGDNGIGSNYYDGLEGILQNIDLDFEDFGSYTTITAGFKEYDKELKKYVLKTSFFSHTFYPETPWTYYTDLTNIHFYYGNINDFSNSTFHDGCIVLDTDNNELYYRDKGEWVKVTDISDPKTKISNAYLSCIVKPAFKVIYSTLLGDVQLNHYCYVGFYERVLRFEFRNYKDHENRVTFNDTNVNSLIYSVTLVGYDGLSFKYPTPGKNMSEIYYDAAYKCAKSEIENGGK